MKIRTKIIFAVVGVLFVGGCTTSKDNTPTTTTTANHVQTTITNPTTPTEAPKQIVADETTTSAPEVTTTTNKKVTVTTIKPVTVTTSNPVTTTTKPVVTTTTNAPVADYKTAGSFCSPAGATGTTKNGITVSCKTSATDTRNRWRV